MQVRELIGGPVSSCTEDTATRTAAERMIADDVGSLAVLNDDELVGIVTERDLVREFAEGETGTRTVGDIMTPNPDSLAPDIDIEDAADWMMGAGYRHLPVIEGDKVIGMLSIKDILWALTDRR